MLTPGQILDQRYRIQRMIASGGLANVYLAFDHKRQTAVIIKIFYKGLLNHPDFALCFVRELGPLIELAHPNISRIYGFKHVEGVSFLVMSYIDGESLTEKMRKQQGALAMEEVTSALKQLGAALAYAHHEGVIHGDLKPNNLIFQDDGRVIITDFGLAQALGKAAKRAPVGDVAFLSPEQIRGEPPTDKSDIYSLGALAFLMTTGTPPISGVRPWRASMETPPVDDAPLTDPCLLNSELNEAMCAVVKRAMARDPQDRWPDIPAMIAAWNQATEQSLPIPEPVPSSIHPPKPPPSGPNGGERSERRRGRAWGVVAGVLLVGMLLLGLFGLRHGGGSHDLLTAPSPQTVSQALQPGGLPTWTPTRAPSPSPTATPVVSSPTPTPQPQSTETPIWTDTGIGRPAENAPHTVWIIGDSITRGLFAASETATFRNQLFNALAEAFPGEIHTTFWETACTLRDLERLWDRWEGNPDLIFIEIGVNDIREKGQETKRCPLIPREEWPDRFGAMLDRIQEDAPNAQIVIGLIPWCGWDETHPKYRRAQEYNAWIRKEAAQRDIIIADLWQVTVGRGDGLSTPDQASAFPPYYHGDNFHPNDTGHQRIANAFLTAYLKAMGLTQADNETTDGIAPATPHSP